MANSIEREGIHNCGIIAERNGWMFREQPINDIGIDAHIEKVDDSGKSRKLLALQIKSGESWFQEIKNDCVIFRDIQERQYNYWIENTLPCILVLYNPQKDVCIWEKLTSDTIKKTKNGNGKGYFIEVPFSHLFLDDASNKELLDLSNLPNYIVNYNFLLSQLEFMSIIKNGGKVTLHSKEWVNKSSGRGETELIVEYNDSTKYYAYPYYFPYTPYDDVFPKLFPWADFTPDEDFYEDSDRNSWQENECYYDNETDEYIKFGKSFSEYRDDLNKFRYIDHVGEVAEYMLVLTLNNLGESFLKVNEYVSKKQAYIIARPSNN